MVGAAAVDTSVQRFRGFKGFGTGPGTDSEGAGDVTSEASGHLVQAKGQPSDD